jgi:hypothetical protein
MSSSRIDHERGIVTMTTPRADCPVGRRFFAVGSAASYGIGYADWVERRVLLRPAANGHAWNVGLDTTEAELALQQRLGLPHPSLVESPVRPDAEQR